MRDAVLGFIGLCLAATAAHAVGLDSTPLPGCRSPLVIKELQSRLATGIQTSLPAGVRLKRLAPVSETGREDTDLLDRRFCEARARLSDGKWPVLLYVIERQGADDSFEVRYCLPVLQPGTAGTCTSVRSRIAGP
jgi:hypothetical protein